MDATRTRERCWGLIAILAASFVLKAALLVPAHQTRPARDAFDYVRSARALYWTGEYTSSRAPLYPATLAGIMWLVPPPRHPGRGLGVTITDLDAARLLQVVLSTLTVVMVYLLGREIFDHRGATVAAGMTAFYPDLVGYSHLLWAETVFVLLNVSWVLFLLLGIRTERLGWMAACGAAFGLAALTRQVILSFLPIIVVWVWFVRPQPWRMSARFVAPLVLAAVLVVAPWTVRNAFVHGAFVPVEPKLGWVLLFGAADNPMRELKRAGVKPSMDLIERDRRSRARALEIIRADPAEYIRKIIAGNLLRMWQPGSMVLLHLSSESKRSPYGYPSMPSSLCRAVVIVFALSYLAVMILASIGVFLTTNWRASLLMIAMAAHATLVHALFGGFDRHRLYLMPFAIMFAAFPASRSIRETRELLTGKRRVLAAVSLAVVVALLANANYEPLFRHWQRFQLGP